MLSSFWTAPDTGSDAITAELANYAAARREFPMADLGMRVSADTVVILFMTPRQDLELCEQPFFSDPLSSS